MTSRAPLLFSFAAAATLTCVLTGIPASAQAPTAVTSGDPVVATTVRAVTIIGAHDLPAARIVPVALRAAVGKSGDDPATVRAVVDAVIGLYRKEGYPLAQVTATEVHPDGTLALTIAEGTIRRILVRGNSKTRTSIVLAALGTRSGEVYQEDRIREARNRLSRLGIFSDVIVSPAVNGAAAFPEDAPRGRGRRNKDNTTTDTTPESRADTPGNTDAPPPSAAQPQGQGGASSGQATPPPPATPSGGGVTPAPAVLPIAASGGEDEVGLVDIVVRVKERQTGNVAATLGYGDGNGLVGFLDLSEDNFLGTAQRVSVQWQRSNQARFLDNGEIVDDRTRTAYGISFEQPILGPRGIGYRAELYDKDTVYQPYFAGNDETLRTYELRRGGSLRVGRPVSHLLSVFLTARHDQVGYDPIPSRLNPPLAELDRATATVAALGLNLIADAREGNDSPRRGYYASLGYEQASHGFGGNRNFGQAVADLRRYTALGPKPNSPILAVRVLGGTSTGNVPLSEQFWLGGYELLRGYGLYSIRGDRMLLTSVEGRVALTPSIQAVGFTDYGGAWIPNAAFNVSTLKAGVGAGLRFLTPIGPIRFDLAYGDRFRTYISLGQSY